MIQVKCTLCSKEFVVAPNRKNRSKNLFCCRKCQLDFQKRESYHSECPVCNKSITTKASHARKIKGSICCSRTCRWEYLKTHYLGKNNPNNKYNYLELIFQKRLDSIKKRSEDNNIAFDLDLKYLLEAYNNQQGQCYYTSIPMQLKTLNFSGQADLDVISVDRIIPKLGYTKGNIVLCCNAINKLKGNASIEDFNSFLHFVVNKNNEVCRIKVKKSSPKSKMPMRVKLGDIGYDLFVDRWEDLGSLVKIYTGISVQPEIGWYLEIYPRSSIYKKGLILANSVGIIDNNYRGEICAFFHKAEDYKEPVIGERLLQAIPKRYAIVEFKEVQDLDDSERGEGGFGSTGMK